MANVETLQPSLAARTKEKMDIEVHALRGFKLPNRRCLLILTLVEHLKNPLPTSRLDLRALKIRCKLEEQNEEEEEEEKVPMPAARKLSTL